MKLFWGEKSIKFKILLRKYLLLPFEIVFFYSVFLLSLLIYTEAFNSFFNLSFLVLFPLFLFLRFLDDFCDFEKDKLEEKAIFSKKTLLIFIIFTFILNFVLSLITKRYFFIVLALFIFLSIYFGLKFLKVLILPFCFALIIYYEFNFDFSNLIFLSLSFILSFIFALYKNMKQKKNCTKNFSIEEIGGKAYNLQVLKIKNTPDFYPIKAEYLNPPNIEKLKLIIEDFCKKNKLL